MTPDLQAKNSRHLDSEKFHTQNAFGLIHAGRDEVTELAKSARHFGYLEQMSLKRKGFELFCRLLAILA